VFLRRIRPCGKGRRQEYWALLESYRTAKGSRQRVVAYLGKLSAKQVSGWEKLAARIEGKPPVAAGLFDPPVVDEETDRFAWVDLKNVCFQNLREFGQVYLAWVLWRMLGLDRFLSGLMPRGMEEVPWSVTASILCIARFCQPSSELYIERHFYPKSALEDLLGVSCAQVQTDRLYRGLDHLLKHKKVIEGHLRQRLGQLFDLSFDILLYDLTSTYFEGQCAANDMAKHGYSRDSRGDCPQVVIALVVTSDGYPLGYEVFDGNTADSTTVRKIVEKVENEHGKSKRIWVMDRGNVSQENLAFIRERGGQYIVGTPKAMLRQVKGELSADGWKEVRQGIQVKTVKLPDDDKLDTTETLVLCKSEDRVGKESAMLDRFVKRMEEGLVALSKSAVSGRLKDTTAAHQRLGRLRERNWRAAACFEVNIEENAGKLAVTWKRDEQAKRDLCGCYLLRTNVAETDPVKLWQQYIQLVDAEWAFRITKDELELRPIWHQNKDRVLAHILVCFIAYAMWKTLGGWMKASGLGDAPRELLEEMKAVKSGDVLLPTRADDGSAGATMMIRCVTRPDEHTAVLLNRLGIELPNHLRRERLQRAASAAEVGAM
jgi:transposase